ncbi:MAG: Hpt domain-containing protein [Bacteroidia bacterium]|nr:Hpt domain-containing protein [Bacteroidia bacterium]
MQESNPVKNTENVCNLKYMTEMLGGKKNLITEIMETFLKQIKEEIKSINEAIATTNYLLIRSLSHTMKSSVSIMGISILVPVLKEMENLSKGGAGIERLKELNNELNLICEKAIREIEVEKMKYV